MTRSRKQKMNSYQNVHYKKVYRDYYIQQFKYIYSMLIVNHRQHIQLMNHIYVMNELIRSGKTEYRYMLSHQEVWFKSHINTMNDLMMNVWKLIDDLDHSCFPHIDFRYEHEFRNIYVLFELIQKIISNKIE